MPWKSQGDGGSGGGPWGGGGGGPVGPRPPDFEDFIRKGQDRFKRMLPGAMGTGWGLFAIIAVVLALWGFSGFYRVQPDEQGVELVFGRWDGITTESGLRWNYPYPIGTVATPRVTSIQQIQIGFRPSGDRGRGTKRKIDEESLMLTGDQNIIDIEFTVQWKIADAGQFLFQIRDPEATVKIAAESAMREIIGQTDIQQALAEARQDIEFRTRGLLQRILNEYRAGIEVTKIQLQDVQPPSQVIDAFDDVQRAQQDRDRARNEAEAYRNDILPRARGEAQRMIQGAAAYKERLENEAEGEAQRFLSVYAAYKQNPAVTTRRMYLETLQNVLSQTDKVIMDPGVQGAVPYLPLNELRRASKPGDASSK